MAIQKGKKKCLCTNVDIFCTNKNKILQLGFPLITKDLAAHQLLLSCCLTGAPVKHLL